MKRIKCVLVLQLNHRLRESKLGDNIIDVSSPIQATLQDMLLMIVTVKRWGYDNTKIQVKREVYFPRQYADNLQMTVVIHKSWSFQKMIWDKELSTSIDNGLEDASIKIIHDQ